MISAGRVTLAVVIVVGVTACASPEATRQRGGGAGADVGNRGNIVIMHEGSHRYWQTPRRPGISGPSIEPARQAARLSER
jgi:hypothetical protein